MSSEEPTAFSVVVMTYNEEGHIAHCLQSVAGLSDDIFVLDSFSTDDTVAIATAHGARVEQHAFDTYAAQRRRMISRAKYDWILTLDADEFLSSELKESVAKAILSDDIAAYTSNRKSRIGNKWLSHGSWYPDRKIRLFDRRKVKVEGHDVHESLVALPNSNVLHLKGDLMHHADENIAARYQKVRAYSTRAAQGLFAQGKRTNWFRIHIKPGIRFVSSYIFKAGFLDGYYGFVVAKSEGHYVWLRETKLKELRESAKL